MAPKQPQRLRVITLASTKGGTGKTTISSALAVRAAEESKRVALLDLDPQESLASWWTRRGRTKNPKLFEVDATTEAVELLISEGWEWVFVDTAPAKIELIEPGIAVADFVLIPVRPSAFDIEQAAICVELCESHGKAHAFVLNHAQPGKLTKSSVDFLGKRQHGDRDADHDTAGLHGGCDGREIRPGGRKGGAARKEIDALWAAVRSCWLRRWRDVGSRRRGHADPGQVCQAGRRSHSGWPPRPRDEASRSRRSAPAGARQHQEPAAQSEGAARIPRACERACRSTRVSQWSS